MIEHLGGLFVESYSVLFHFCIVFKFYRYITGILQVLQVKQLWVDMLAKVPKASCNPNTCHVNEFTILGRELQRL